MIDEKTQCTDCGATLELTVVKGAYSPLRVVVACDCAQEAVGGIHLTATRLPPGWR